MTTQHIFKDGIKTFLLLLLLSFPAAASAQLNPDPCLGPTPPAWCGGVATIPPTTCSADSDCPLGRNPCVTVICNTQKKCELVRLSGVACTGPDFCLTYTCQSGVCQESGVVNCNDKIDCTTDGCFAGEGCRNTPFDHLCADDNNTCTVEYCDAAKGCQRINAVDGISCSGDNNDCTLDVCRKGACAHEAQIGAACSDGKLCTVNDKCTVGSAVIPICAGTGKDCSQLNGLCASGRCDSISGECKAVPFTNGAPCRGASAPDSCHKQPLCQGGVCAEPQLTTGWCFINGACVLSGGVNPNNGCEVCNTGVSVNSWTPLADGSPLADGRVCGGGKSRDCLKNSDCNDGNACTTDTCVLGGVCLNAAIDPDDGNVCTTDSCDPATGISHATVSDPRPEDAGVCEMRWCDQTRGWINVVNPAMMGKVCAAGDACNSAGLCQSNGSCSQRVPTTDPSPTGAGACEKRACDPATTGWQTVADTGKNGTECKAAADACHEALYCASGVCTGGAAKTDCCLVNADCNDNSACTTDSCVANKCAHSTVSADDGDACTTDNCDPVTGISHATVSDSRPEDAGICEMRWCDQTRGWINVVNPAMMGKVCAAGDACNSAGLCQSNGSCGSRTVITDPRPDAFGSCEKRECGATGWVAAPDAGKNGRSCDDRNYCTGDGVCLNGVCQSGQPIAGIGDVCEAGVGLCRRAGHKICSESGMLSCDASPGDASVEVCDAESRDEDCDGSANEGCECINGQQKECFRAANGQEFREIGTCEHGWQRCAAGRWGTECEDAKGPAEEVCDGRDNNCNGEIDDVTGVGETCTSKCGYGSHACDVKTGQLICVDSSANECGGCAELAGEVGGECIEDCQKGAYACSEGGESLVCNDKKDLAGFHEKCGKVNACRKMGEYVCSGDGREIVCQQSEMHITALHLKSPEECKQPAIPGNSEIFDLAKTRIVPLPEVRNSIDAVAYDGEIAILGSNSEGMKNITNIDMRNIGRGALSRLLGNEAISRLSSVKLGESAYLVLGLGRNSIYAISNLGDEEAEGGLLREIGLEGVKSIEAAEAFGDGGLVILAKMSREGENPPEAGDEAAAEAAPDITALLFLQFNPENITEPSVEKVELAGIGDFGEGDTFLSVAPDLSAVRLFAKEINEAGGEVSRFDCMKENGWHCARAGAARTVPDRGFSKTVGIKDISSDDYRQLMASAGAEVAEPVSVIEYFVDGKSLEEHFEGVRLTRLKLSAGLFEPYQALEDKKVKIGSYDVVVAAPDNSIRICSKKFGLPEDSEWQLMEKEQYYAYSTIDQLFNRDEQIFINPHLLVSTPGTGAGGPGLVAVWDMISGGELWQAAVFYLNRDEVPQIDVTYNVETNKALALAMDPAGDKLSYGWSLADKDGKDISLQLSERDGPETALLLDLGQVDVSLNALFKEGVKGDEAKVSWPVTLTATATDPAGESASASVAIDTKGKTVTVPEKPPEEVIVVPKQETRPLEGSWGIVGGACSLSKGVEKDGFWTAILILGFTSILWWPIRWWTINRVRCRVRVKEKRGLPPRL